MVRLRIWALAALALGGWLVASALTSVPAQAAARPAAEILANFEAVEIPKLDPSERGDTTAMTAYLLKRKAAMAERGALLLELFRSYPDHPKLPELFSSRWQDLLRTEADSLPDGRLAAELDEVVAKAKDSKLKSDAAFFKTILEVQTGQGGPEEILKLVDKFIKIAPKDERGGLLLYSIANQMEGSPKQAELLRRVVADYPTTPFADPAKTSLKKLESVGKPFELEFTDAIKGTPISMKALRGKVVVVDFWATWCGPCVGEMPRMKELYETYRGQGVEFIGISLDKSKEEGGLDKLKEFVATNRITWPQYYQGKGWDSEFSGSWGITAIPALFVVDQDGKLYSIDARSHLEEILPELLKKGAPGKAGE